MQENKLYTKPAVAKLLEIEVHKLDRYIGYQLPVYGKSLKGLSLFDIKGINNFERYLKFLKGEQITLPSDLLLDAKAATKYLSMTNSQLHYLVKQGEVKVTMVSKRKWLYRVGDLDNYLNVLKSRAPGLVGEANEETS